MERAAKKKKNRKDKHIKTKLDWGIDGHTDDGTE